MIPHRPELFEIPLNRTSTDAEPVGDFTGAPWPTLKQLHEFHKALRFGGAAAHG
jgi:hypothetical protein